MSTTTPAPAKVVERRIDGGQAADPKSAIFAALLWACMAISAAFLGFVMIDIIVEGIARFDSNLFTQGSSRIRPETAGVRPAILGTLLVIGLMILIVLPLGIGAAVYLEEYADKDRWFNRVIELNIQNLAAVPSVIYGILALAFVVRQPFNLGPVALSAAIALALLILPIIIIGAREALRAVPSDIRFGSLALGATRWQTVQHQLLPASIPGIATASILGVSRAVGEAAPVILVGAATFITFNPGPLSAFTVLPVQIYGLSAQPDEASKMLAYAAILLLILLLLVMNGVAIYLRNRFQQRW